MAAPMLRRRRRRRRRPRPSPRVIGSILVFSLWPESATAFSIDFTIPRAIAFRQDDRCCDRCHDNVGVPTKIEVEYAPMPALKPGENPRKLFRHHHRERGQTRLFTLSDLASAAHEAPATTRSRLRTTTDARTAALYIIDALARRSEKLSDEEVVQTLKNVTLVEWHRRWPRFDLYRCGFPDCTNTMVEPGLCPRHGGSIRPLVMIDGDHFVMWTGREYVEICHVIFGVSSTTPVEHLDRNTWNSHPDNLAAPADRRVRVRQRHRWSYGYRELGNLFGLSETGVRQAASRGILDPSSLRNICSFWALKHGH